MADTAGDTERALGENRRHAKKLALHVDPRITEQDRHVLKLLVSKVQRPGMLVAEVGSFLGNGSTLALLEVVRQAGGRLHCIDTWKGNENVQWHLDLAREYSLFDTFMHYVRQAGGEQYVAPIAMTSEEALEEFDDGACDLVFIDGDHSFAGVSFDIQGWKAKVKPGGILCGHDCEVALDEVDENLIDRNLAHDFVEIDNSRFHGVHPGVVRAVDDCFGNSATLWAHRDLAEYGFHGRSTIWHVVV